MHNHPAHRQGKAVATSASGVSEFPGSPACVLVPLLGDMEEAAMAAEPPALPYQDVFSAACRGDVEALQAILAAKPREGAAVRGYDGCVGCGNRTEKGGEGDSDETHVHTHRFNRAHESIDSPKCQVDAAPAGGLCRAHEGGGAAAAEPRRLHARAPEPPPTQRHEPPLVRRSRPQPARPHSKGLTSLNRVNSTQPNPNYSGGWRRRAGGRS